MRVLIQWIIFAYSLASLAVFAENAEVTPIDSQALITRYDQLRGNRKWRLDVPGAYRTKWGLQFDQTCIKRFPNRAEAIQKLDYWADTAIQSVVQNCGQMYPELRDYVEQWVTQFRRAVVICESEAHVKYGAYAETQLFYATQTGNVTIDPRDYFKRTKTRERERKQPQTKWMANVQKRMESVQNTIDLMKNEEKTIAENYEATYVFGPGHLLRTTSLIHEVFHSTSANNKLNHAISYLDDTEDRIHIEKEDRIYGLADLCSPNLSSKRDRIFNKLLHPNLSTCFKMFTEWQTGSSDRISKPLSNKDALSFCKTLEAQKACVLQNPSKTSLVEKEIHSVLQAYQDEAIPYFAQWPSHVPKKAQLLLPKEKQERLRELLQENMQNECFNETIFVDAKTGDLTVASSGEGFNFKQFSIFMVDNDHFSFVKEECKNEKDLLVALEILESVPNQKGVMGLRSGIGQVAFLQPDYKTLIATSIHFHC